MSQKITAKNLSYTQNLPPFLAALHGQAARDANSPDPILAARRRPVKPRSGSAEAEDEPLVLDEDGNVVSGVTVGVDGAVRERDPPPPEAGDAEGGGTTEAGPKQADAKEKVAGIGAGKKRKVGKVVGGGGGSGDGDDDEDGRDGGREPEERRSYKAKEETRAKSTNGGAAAGDKAAGAKGKKKAKKIKLSFNDGDGD